ncbi:MAG: hypothetical protein A3K09_02305 [Nitrospinae bacterium RIFCSPLOWO2_12_FULL_47_7]|nr:MAG: hypothetical protein A3K09_02305 [Nitrospinae bacterium RIFCSPLOWO2_12_FULL_47_7]
MRRIGLLAGAGDIPVYFARKASAEGIKLVSIAFSDEIASHLAPYAEKIYSIGVGQAGKIYKTLRKENITEIMIMGKVEKNLIFKLQMFDLKAIKFLSRLKTKEDKVLMVNVIRVLEEDGFRVLNQREYVREIFPGKGVLTQRKPSKREMEDVEFGFPIARKMADMEIGQTVVVKNKTVVAVEAIEGTDQALERGCVLARTKAIAIKVSRTNQDYRYDSPGIGPDTVRILAASGASVLALEAERIMIVNQPQVVKMADNAGLSIVCV